MPAPSTSLFTRARAGDGEALDQLLRAHRDAVTAVCRRRLRSRVDADDAVQETMVRAMGALDAVRDERRLASWLCRIAERVCLDMMRAGARPMVGVDAVPVEEPEAVTIRREEAELVRRALAALGERQAEALWMRDALGEPVPAVADRLGMTEGSARVLLARARKRMREGWAQVAALLPGVGWKAPAPLAKVVALGPAVAAPAAVVVAAALVLPGLGTDDRVPPSTPPAVTAPAPVPAPPPAPATPVAAPAGDPVTSSRVVQPVATVPAARPTTPVADPPTPAAPGARIDAGPVGAVQIDREDRDDPNAIGVGDEDVLGVEAGLTDLVEGLGLAAPLGALADGLGAGGPVGTDAVDGGD